MCGESKGSNIPCRQFASQSVSNLWPVAVRLAVGKDVRLHVGILQ
jgi:hypothetical protein